MRLAKEPKLGHILFGFFLDPKPQYIRTSGIGDKAAIADKGSL